LRCWGSGSAGKLGHGNENDIGDDEAPSDVEVVPIGGTVLQVSVGGSHSCALLEGGVLRCWGWGDSGRLGYGNTDDIGDDELPSDVGPVSVGGSVARVAAGVGHTCAVLEGGELRCWGDNSSGKLGYDNANDIGDDELPSEVAPVYTRGSASRVAIGSNHTCVALDSGDVKCWGSNVSGQLGYGNTDVIGSMYTLGVVSLGGPTRMIDSLHAHTCALLESGDLFCWGWEWYGQLGYGSGNSVGDNEVPTDVGPVSFQ